MKSISKTTLSFVVALVFTIVVSGAYVFFFVAMKDKIDAADVLSTNSGEISNKESRTLSAVAALKNESANIEKLNSNFIKESEIVLFTKKVEAIGPQSGATLAILSLEPGFTEKTIPFLSLRIKIKGKFADVVQALTLLENFPGKFEWKTARLVLDSSAIQQSGGQSPAVVSTPEWSAEVFLTVFNFIKE